MAPGPPAREDLPLAEWCSALAERDCVKVMDLLKKYPRLILHGWEATEEWVGRTALHVAASRGCLRLVMQIFDNPYIQVLDSRIENDVRSFCSIKEPATNAEAGSAGKSATATNAEAAAAGQSATATNAEDTAAHATTSEVGTMRSVEKPSPSIFELVNRTDEEYNLNAMAMALITGNADIISALLTWAISPRQRLTPIIDKTWQSLRERFDYGKKVGESEGDGKLGKIRVITEEVLKSLRSVFQPFFDRDNDFNFLPIEEYFFHWGLSVLSVNYESGSLQSGEFRDPIRKIVEDARNGGGGLLHFLLGELKDAQGRTAFHCAAAGGLFSLLLGLVPNGSEFEDCLNARDDGGRTVLHRLVLSVTTNVSVIKDFVRDKRVDLGAEIKIASYASEYDWYSEVNRANGFRHFSASSLVSPRPDFTAIEIATILGRAEYVQLLIEADKGGRTLYKQCNRSIFRAQSSGADHFDVEQERTTLIQLAVCVQNSQIVRLLLQDSRSRGYTLFSQALPPKDISKRRIFPFHGVVSFGKPIIKIKMGFEQNYSNSYVLDEENKTIHPFHLAASFGNPTIIKIFSEEQDFDPLILDKEENTVFHHCVSMAEVKPLIFHDLLDFLDLDHFKKWQEEKSLKKWQGKRSLPYDLLDFFNLDHLKKQQEEKSFTFHDLLDSFNLDYLKKWQGEKQRWEKERRRDKEKRRTWAIANRSAVSVDYAQMRGHVNLLLQCGADIWKANKKGYSPDPALSAPEEFTTWWYEKVARVTQEEQNGLNTAANAISLISALIATASYIGPLTPPLGYDDHTHQMQVSMFLVRIFIICDTLSFYLALASIILSLIPSLPILQESMFQELGHTRRTVTWAVTFLFPSIVCVFIAFAAASIAVIPDDDIFLRGTTSAIGGIVCLVVMISFSTRLVRLIFYKSPRVRRLYKL